MIVCRPQACAWAHPAWSGVLAVARGPPGPAELVQTVSRGPEVTTVAIAVPIELPHSSTLADLARPSVRRTGHRAALHARFLTRTRDSPAAQARRIRRSQECLPPRIVPSAPNRLAMAPRVSIAHTLKPVSGLCGRSFEPSLCRVTTTDWNWAGDEPPISYRSSSSAKRRRRLQHAADQGRREGDCGTSRSLRKR